MIFLFGLSEAAQMPRFDLFFLGLLLLVGGFVMIRRYRPPPNNAPSDRFRLIRRLFTRKKK